MQATLSLLFAVFAALSNALGTVLQRRAALTVPMQNSFSVRLVLSLLRRPVWFFGIAAVICAALFQGLALALGSLAVVQPVFVTELPFALIIASLFSRRWLPTRGWTAVLAIAGGLGLAMSAADPSGGHRNVQWHLWVLALAFCGGAMAMLVSASFKRPNGPTRAAFLGLAAAIGYALTAALMKTATEKLARGIGVFFTSWETYAFAAVGVCALFLLENAMQAGPLVASQPALTLGDALISLSLGVTLYGQSVRTGWWLIPEIIGCALILAGSIGLSKMTQTRELVVPPKKPGGSVKHAKGPSGATRADVMAAADGRQHHADAEELRPRTL